MERIARRAEVAVGTLYNHFVDRAALMEALFENRRRAMHERVDEALARTETLPFRARLQEVVDAIVIVPPDALRVRRLLLQEAPPYKLPTHATFEKFEPLFAQGRTEKALRPDVFGMQIRALHALLFVAVRTAVEDGDAASLRALSDEIVRQFLDGSAP
jgi:AcrR family transcriptional regulator